MALRPRPSSSDTTTSSRSCSTPRGSMVTDAYFAALALESGCEWVTTDRDYARFAGLAWRHPLVEREGPLR